VSNPQSNLEKIGSLWKQQSKKGNTYLRGEIDGQKVMIFKVREKRTDKSPDYQVFKAGAAPACEPSHATPVIDNDDIPF